MASTLSELFHTAQVAENGCNITQIAPNIYRISTPVPSAAFPPFGFTFNSFLIVDESPVLIHTGMKQLFLGVKAAVERVIALDKLRYIFSSHHEPDEDGSLLSWLDAAPNAQLLSSTWGQFLARMLHWADFVNGKRAIATINEGQEFSIGKYKLRFVYTPHFPHGWETGYLFETTTRSLFCGDIFTQTGANPAPLIEEEEKLFHPVNGHLYGWGNYPHDPFEKEYMLRNTRTDENFKKFIDLNPAYLMTMHGSSYKGDCARALARLNTMVK